MDIIQYNAVHKFVEVLDNPRATGFDLHLTVSIAISYEKWWIYEKTEKERGQEKTETERGQENKKNDICKLFQQWLYHWLLVY